MTKPSRVIRRAIAASPFVLSVVFALLLPLACGKGAETTSSAQSPAPPTPPAVATPQVSLEGDAIVHMMKAYEVQRFDDVIAEAKDFEKKFPSSSKLPQALYLLGRASIDSGHFTEGTAALRRILDKYPNDENAPFADLYIAQALYLQGYQLFASYKIDFQQALGYYQKALEAFRVVEKKYIGDPEVSTRARLMVAQTLYSMHKPQEALAAFRAYLDKEPHGHYADQVMFQVGTILAEAGRNEEAKEVYAKLGKEFPGTPGAGTAVERLAELNMIGQPMPPLEIDHWANREVKLSSLKGKVVVVTFWGTWCPHCQHEIPKMETIYRALKPKGLVMIGITQNAEGQNDQMLNNFIHEKGLTFPIGVDKDGISNSRYAVSRIPATAIIDRRGIVRWRNSGMLLTQALIERFLNERPVAAKASANGLVAGR
jgi:TolA-binding protein/peroxiredoxin